jgi:hypothetical protein
MSAALLVLEPFSEVGLPPEQHAYRPGRSAPDAVKQDLVATLQSLCLSR